MLLMPPKNYIQLTAGKCCERKKQWIVCVRLFITLNTVTGNVLCASSQLNAWPFGGHTYLHISESEKCQQRFFLLLPLSLSRYFSLKRTKFCENAKGIKFYHRNWVALRFDVAYWITKRIRGIRMFSTSYQNYISKSTNTTNLPSNLFARIETFWSHGLD